MTTTPKFFQRPDDISIAVEILSKLKDARKDEKVSTLSKDIIQIRKDILHNQSLILENKKAMAEDEILIKETEKHASSGNQNYLSRTFGTSHRAGINHNNNLIANKQNQIQKILADEKAGTAKVDNKLEIHKCENVIAECKANNRELIMDSLKIDNGPLQQINDDLQRENDALFKKLQSKGVDLLARTVDLAAQQGITVIKDLTEGTVKISNDAASPEAPAAVSSKRA